MNLKDSTSLEGLLAKLPRKKEVRKNVSVHVTKLGNDLFDVRSSDGKHEFSALKTEGMRAKVTFLLRSGCILSGESLELYVSGKSRETRNLIAE